MGIVIEENDMDGESVYVSSAEDLAKVPAQHRRLIGQAERLALADPAGYFRDLAGRAKRRHFRQWLGMLADCEHPILELHIASSASFPGFPPAVYFRFALSDDFTPAVRLRPLQSRSTEAMHSLPPALAEVYELIDGINHFGYGSAGELHSPADIGTFPNEVWRSDANSIDAQTCMVFFTSLGGDMICFQPPDRVVRYSHEIGELRQAGSLDAWVNRYFQKMIQGEVLEHN